jgi:U4/U6.U5 tri-snRNP component SNU23
MHFYIFIAIGLKEEKLREYRKEKKKDRKRRYNEVADDDNAAGEQDDMAAMMGFSGFGTSKK